MKGAPAHPGILNRCKYRRDCGEPATEKRDHAGSISDQYRFRAGSDRRPGSTRQVQRKDSV